MLFVWKNTDYGRGYRGGLIAADADSLAEARAKLRGAFPVDCVERYHCGWLDEDGDPVIPDDWAREEFDRYKAKFDADIAKEPTFPETLFMYGGD